MTCPVCPTQKDGVSFSHLTNNTLARKGKRRSSKVWSPQAPLSCPENRLRGNREETTEILPTQNKTRRSQDKPLSPLVEVALGLF